MGKLVEDPFGAEVVTERLREYECVGDERPAGVVTDEQHRTSRRHVVHPPHLASEVDVGQRAKRRQRPPDVLGVAKVEGVLGRPPADQATWIHDACEIRRRGTKHPSGPYRRTRYTADEACDRPAKTHLHNLVARIGAPAANRYTATITNQPANCIDIHASIRLSAAPGNGGRPNERPSIGTPTGLVTPSVDTRRPASRWNMPLRPPDDPWGVRPEGLRLGRASFSRPWPSWR